MKQIVLLLLAGSIFMFSCKEKSAPIDLLPAPDKIDTTYLLSSLPKTDAHQVLIENFTGATCSNCPGAHEIIHSIDSQYAGKINVLNLFVTDFSQTLPPIGAVYDFRSAQATSIETSVFGQLPGMPIASIDRSPTGLITNPLFSHPGSWPSIVASRVGSNDNLNLAVSSTYSASTGKASIHVKVTYLQPVSFKQNLSIAIVEDSFIDKQEYFDGVGTGTYPAYHFNDVFREMVTSVPFGDKILDTLTLKEPKRVYEVTYFYKVPTTYHVPNCRVIAFVTTDANAGGATVFQSAQAKLTP